MPGFWQRLDDTLAGMVPGSGGIAAMQDRRAERQAAQLAAQQAAIRGHRAQALQEKVFKGDPMAELLMLLNPGEATKNMATQYAAANVSGGDQRYLGPNRAPFEAPKMGMDAGTPYVQTSQGAKFGKPRPVTAVEAANMAHQRAQEALAEKRFNAEVEQFAKTHGLDREKAAEIVRHNMAQEGIGWFNAKKPPASGGGSGGGAYSAESIKWD